MPPEQAIDQAGRQAERSNAREPDLYRASPGLGPTAGNVIRDAYAGRAEEYTALLGSMANTHESDQRLVAQWARDLRGAVIDAGCGPGHWTDFLQKRGVDAEGIDQVQAFIGRARERFPTVPFRVASLGDLKVRDGYAAAILAWYSVIHLAPNDLPAVLREFAR